MNHTLATVLGLILGLLAASQILQAQRLDSLERLNLAQSRAITAVTTACP